MATRKTCDKCEHYTPPDRCYGWGHRAGVYVAPKFGCLHWAKKTPKGSPGEPLSHDTDSLTKE